MLYNTSVLETLNNNIVIFVTITCLLVFFNKKFSQSKYWRPTVTPLASIIGSGFLVSAPLLIMTTGTWAVLTITVVVMLAYLIGSIMRFNITHVEPQLRPPRKKNFATLVDNLSHPILAIAYIISVAFYLKLLSAFVLSGMKTEHNVLENTLTTLILILIGITGKLRGLSMLEDYEIYAVSIKMAVIIALLFGMAFYNGELAIMGAWAVHTTPQGSAWENFRKLLGILIIVQGFETSRYLGYAYDTKLRNQTMKYAQWASGIIYVAFIGLSLVTFNYMQQITETVIIDMSFVVAPILPGILIFAAVMSQFSAAVADTIGTGGLLAELTHHRISVKTGYLLITLISIALTWLTDIYQIITYASKAFALYYTFQAIAAIITLWRNKQKDYLKITLFSALLVLLLLVVFFSIPVE